jgi:histidine triad (HIT) family protein
MSCIFCEIGAGNIPAEIVWRGEHGIAFLDNRPLFPGHVLLVPSTHIETLADPSSPPPRCWKRP